MFPFPLTIDHIEDFSVGPIIMCEKYYTLSKIDRLIEAVKQLLPIKAPHKRAVWGFSQFPEAVQ